MNASFEPTGRPAPVFSLSRRIGEFALLAVCIVAGACAGPRTAASVSASRGGDGSMISVIPLPASVVATQGSFVLRANTAIVFDPAFTGVAELTRNFLQPATGFALTLTPQSGRNRAAGGNAIVLRKTELLSPLLGSEGYRLTVGPTVVLVEAAEPAGAFYAIQTLRQLLPAEIFREAVVHGVAWSVPAVTIQDSPRFAWRGAHLDVSRHFMPKEFVKKYIDLLALHKMNSFHWHLTDDQGWRLEIKQYPRLTEVGAWRSETLIGRMRRTVDSSSFDRKPHGGYYTQDDAREIVEYAKARFINVIPEIEMPGHAQAVIAAYPALASTDRAVEVRKVWGVSEHLLNPSDSTITFLKNVLTEVLGIFPSPFIHIGGDEAVKNEWRTHPIARERMRAAGLATEDELQSWFIRQFDTFLVQRGRRLVGWDEILEGGLAPNAVVMSWRGVNGGIAAAREGHDVIMTPTSHTYFDYYQSRDPGEPLAIGGFLPLDSVYAYEPIPAQLEPQFVKHILGAQAQLWTEYMEGPKHVEYMAYPRMSALAEVVWSPRDRRDYGNFTQRLRAHLRRLDALDVNYRRPR